MSSWCNYYIKLLYDSGNFFFYSQARFIWFLCSHFCLPFVACLMYLFFHHFTLNVHILYISKRFLVDITYLGHDLNLCQFLTLIGIFRAFVFNVVIDTVRLKSANICLLFVLSGFVSLFFSIIHVGNSKFYFTISL